MEVKKYNPFVVMNKPKSKAKPKSKPKVEAKGLSLENKKRNLILFMLKVLLRQVRNSYYYNYS